MNVNNLNISKIETFLNSIVDDVVSKNTFFTSLPDASVIKASDWQDMVLVDFPIGIKDLEAYGSGLVSIILYARPFESGKKNIARMSQLEKALNDAIAHASKDEYVLWRDDVRAFFDNDIDWHCNIVTFHIQVM